MRPPRSSAPKALAALALVVLLPLAPSCGRKEAPRPATRPQPPGPSRTAPPGNEGGIRHTLQRGQTLYALSRAYGVSVESIMKANGIEDPSSIPAGTPILIPGATKVLDLSAPAGPRLSWPLRGAVTSLFGPRNGSRHQGVDIQGRRGELIHAAADGVVLQAARAGRYGKTVLLDHGDNYRTRYAHADELLVRDGERVRRGQEIAVVGDTGNATGVHLHFEVLWKGRRLDPIRFLPMR